MKQLFHVFAAAYLVHIEKLRISFGAIFYTLGMLFINCSVLRIRLPLRSGGEDKYPHVLLVLG